MLACQINPLEWETYCGSLDDKQRAYAKRYIWLAGYDPSKLGDDQLKIVFDALARTEELRTGLRHNNHNWEVSYAPYSRQQVRHIPYLEILLELWAEEGLVSPVPFLLDRWPDDKRFALVLTHDVDHIIPYSLTERFRRLFYLRDAPRQRRIIVWLGFLNMLRRALSGRKESWLGLDGWIKVEARYGFRSSFFFFASPLPSPSYEDSFYAFQDVAMFEEKRVSVGQMVREMACRGWDIGLHGSSRSYTSSAILRKERERLEEVVEYPVTTSRQHHLLFDARLTPGVVARAGIEAESTLGSNNSSDYRCGTGLPFFTYDLERDGPLDLIEIPLVIQDVALFRVQQMDEDIAVERSLELVRRASKHRSAITLLWHNSCPEDSPQFRSYVRILKEAAKLDAWGCSVSDINQWWRKRMHRISGFFEG